MDSGFSDQIWKRFHTGNVSPEKAYDWLLTIYEGLDTTNREMSQRKKKIKRQLIYLNAEFNC
jgi:hypothetical protein